MELTLIARGKITGAGRNYAPRTYITEDQDLIGRGDKEMEISHRLDKEYLNAKWE